MGHRRLRDQDRLVPALGKPVLAPVHGWHVVGSKQDVLGGTV